MKELALLLVVFIIGVHYGKEDGATEVYEEINQYMFESEIVKHDINTDKRYLADSTKMSNYLWREINLK